MKRLLVFFFLLISPILLLSQSVDYNDMDNWDDICFCSMNNSFHPQTIVSADNNWRLLLAMKNGLTLKELDSLRIPYSQSQLLLLRSQRLLERTQKVYKTIIPVLDKEQTVALRDQSLTVAHGIYPEIEKECGDLVAYLSKQGRSGNAFSILFSFVLDGLIWNELEQLGFVEERNANGIWSGSYWFMTPKRSFGCGTNSIEESNCRLNINWSQQSPQFMEEFWKPI